MEHFPPELDYPLQHLIDSTISAVLHMVPVISL